MNKIFALAMGVSLVAFVAGCSDDGGDSGKTSCNIEAMKTCMVGSITEKDCTDTTGTVVDSCPANALLTCDEGGVTVNYYDKTMVDLMNGACSK
jgi:hypothetical protein